MTTTINADNGVSSGSAGLKSSADSSGVLALQTNGTTALSIDASQNVSFTNQPTYSGGTANGVAYLNGSKVLTTGSALVFDGTNLGVGVTPSAWGTGSSMDVGTQTSVHYSGSVGTLFGKNVYYNAGYKYKATGTARAYVQDDGGHSWSIAASGTAGNAITFTQAMTLDASGNLGVGTTSPAATFGSNVLQMYGSAATEMRFTSGNSGTTSSDGLSVGIDSSSIAYFYNRENTAIVFGTNNTERARIDSSGNLLVGTTSNAVTNSNSVVVLPAYGQINYQHASGTSSGANYAYFAYNGSGIGSITQNGTTGVLYNLTSDYRLKNNQQPLTGAKEFVMALQPKKWQWWDGSGEGVGFIAHEFMEIAKYSGNGEKDAVDADGKPVYQSIQPSSSEVMANLVAFIQEQQAIITQLQADVAALKGA